MRRKRRDEDAPVATSPSVTGVRQVPPPARLVVPPAAPPAVADPEPVVDPVTAPPESAPEPEPEPRTPDLADPIGLDDLERGRTVALLSALGRIQLTLDLLERRVGRIEERLDRVEEAAGPLPPAPLEALREPAPAGELAEELPADLPADLGDGGVEAGGEDAFENDADAELPSVAPEAPEEPAAP